MLVSVCRCNACICKKCFSIKGYTGRFRKYFLKFLLNKVDLTKQLFLLLNIICRRVPSRHGMLAMELVTYWNNLVKTSTRK